MVASFAKRSPVGRQGDHLPSFAALEQLEQLWQPQSSSRRKQKHLRPSTSLLES